MYVAVHSRPDIQIAAIYLSQFSSKPTSQAWKVLKRVLRYLKSTMNLKLVFSPMDITRQPELLAFSDS